MERFSWDDGNYLEWADQERLVREDLDRIQELRKQGTKRRRNMDKLRLQIEQRPGEIHLNFDEIEKRLDERLVEYKGAVFTEESKSIAKAEVAELRKLKKDIDEARKTVKREWMKPYESFELRVKKLIEKVDEPISFIDDQVKAFERKRKEEKRELIEKLYYEILITYTEYEDYIQLNIIYGPTADFPGCIAFGKTAEFIEKYFKKGMRIGIQGRIQTGQYTNNDGNKVYTTDVVVENCEFVESKSERSNSGNSDNGGFGTPDDDGFTNIPDGIDEELPFN